MIVGDIKNQVDGIWNDFWSGGVSNPLSVMEQITYLLFIRRLDELQSGEEAKALGTGKPIERRIFPEGNDPRGTPYAELRWKNFKLLAPKEMFRVVDEHVFPFIREVVAADGTMSAHMKEARFGIPTAALLAKVVDKLDRVPMQDRDTKGDVYEYMLGKIASAGQNGQFRTPRHIIKLMVELMEPTPRDIICDPAAGTCGFLVAAGEYLREHNPEIFRDAALRKHFHEAAFHGFDFDPTMLRIGSMNMILHGIENPTIVARDSLSEDIAGEKDRYSLILANPPFAGSLDYEQTAREPIMFSPRTLSSAGATQVRLVPEGSVLVSCIGTLGKIGYAGRELATNQQINAITFDGSIVHPRYGFYAAQRLAPDMERQAPATTLPIISKSKFEKLRIPIPPLREQRRIAAILDQADVLRRKRREALERIEHLARSAFDQLCRDFIESPQDWRADLELGQIAEIASGVTKGRRLDGKTTRLVPYLAVANVQDRFLSLDAIKSIEATDAEIARYHLEVDDLLLTEGGDPDKLGRGALWHGEIPDAIHQNHIFRVRLTSTLVHPVFLNWLVGSQRGKMYFLRAAKQTTGIASINMGQLKRFPLIIPPQAKQLRFAGLIDEVEAQKAAQLANLAKLDALFASLQHRAFNGELMAKVAERELAEVG